MYFHVKVIKRIVLLGQNSLNNYIMGKGGAVAEWSKALLLREKINEKFQKDPRFAPPAWATFKKKLCRIAKETFRTL